MSRLFSHPTQFHNERNYRNPVIISLIKRYISVSLSGITLHLQGDSFTSPHPSVQYQNENRLTHRCWYWTGGKGAFKISLYVSFQKSFLHSSSLTIRHHFSSTTCHLFFPSFNMSSILFERDILQSVSSESPFTGHHSPPPPTARAALPGKTWSSAFPDLLMHLHPDVHRCVS